MSATPELVDRLTELYRQYYADEVRELARKYPREQKSLQVDWRDVYRFDPDLAADFLRHPDEIILAAEEALRNYDLPIDTALGNANVRLYGLTEQTQIGGITSSSINQVIGIRGIVDKTLPVESKVTDGVFVCQRCGAENVAQNSNLHERELTEPHQCFSCERQDALELNMDRSGFIDFQKIELREAPIGNRTGNELESVVAYMEDDLAGEASPGDYVELTGVVRKIEPGQYTRASISDKYVETWDVKESNSYSELRISESDENRIIELASSDDIYEKVTESIAPTVYGYDEIKLAIALQLFGGVTKLLPDGSSIRGDSHVLLMGEPGTAKSKLISAAADLSPKALTTNGKRTTGAGLTTAATRTSGGRSAWELEVGPVVLADQGLLAIDDLDQMDENVRSNLLEPMEEQVVTSSKGDVNDVLNARTAISAAANPKYGRFDQFEPLGEQFDLSPGLVSRFDLIFALTDEPDSEKDSKLARHVLNANYVGELGAGEEAPSESAEQNIDGEFERPISKEDLQLFIAIARGSCHPKLTETAKDVIEEFYVQTRSLAEDGDVPVPITVRKIEAIVRLAEASARIRLSDEVTQDDAERAIDLVKSCLADIGVDPEEPEFEPDEFERSPDKEIRDILSIVDNLSDELGDGAPVEQVLNLAVEYGTERSKAEHQIENLKQKGELYEPEQGRLRTT